METMVLLNQRFQCLIKQTYLLPKDLQRCPCFWQASFKNTRIKRSLFGENCMPITDSEKKQIAQKARLNLKICFHCGARNSISATRCRKCHNSYLRLKNRTLGIKK